MSQEQLLMILGNAMNQYVFHKIFQENNDGKDFNLEKWLKDAEELVSDSMFSISQEKQKQFGEMLENLDKYAYDSSENIVDDIPRLTLL